MLNLEKGISKKTKNEEINCKFQIRICKKKKKKKKKKKEKEKKEKRCDRLHSGEAVGSELLHKQETSNLLVDFK